MFSRSCKYLLPFLLLVAPFFGICQTVRACTCGPRPTVLDSYDQSDTVIIARAISVEKAVDTDERQYVDGVRTTTMIVEKIFKGNVKVRDELVFGQGGGADCIWTFDEKSVGEAFLFYLRSPETFSDRSYLPSQEPNLWFAGGCGRSTSVAAANEDLLYLENMSKLRGKTRISGSIGGWRNPDMNVEGKRIRIIGPKKTYEIKTDQLGVFEIYDLPPGKYLIEPETPPGWKIDKFMLGYSPSVVRNDYDEPELKSPKQVAVVLEPKKHAGIDIAFEIDNTIRGRVLGPDGKPMSRVCVYLLAPGQQEGWGSHDCTNQKGEFTITSVPQGEYVLVANQDGKLSSREPFLRAYYPNVSERERAAVITIAPGDVINDLIIVVPKLEETIIVEGVLNYSDGKPVGEKWVRFKAVGADKNVEGDVSEETDSTGHFSLKILKGLRGKLAAEDWLFEGAYVNCPKVDGLISKSGNKGTTIESNVIEIQANQNLYNLGLTFPFPHCEKVKQ